MATGLQCHVHRGARAIDALLVGILECHTLCVQIAVAGVITGGYHIVILYYQCPYKRVRIYTPLALLG